jgi:hypothetical protein
MKIGDRKDLRRRNTPQVEPAVLYVSAQTGL